jgi:hypothetical protein
VDYKQQAKELEELSRAIDTFGKLIGADLSMKKRLRGRGSSNQAGLRAIADKLTELINKELI